MCARVPACSFARLKGAGRASKDGCRLCATKKINRLGENQSLKQKQQEKHRVRYCFSGTF